MDCDLIFPLLDPVLTEICLPRLSHNFTTMFGAGIAIQQIFSTLDQAFKRLGDYFDQEVKRTVQALLAAIEPMAIIGLGAVFGLIVLSILLPLYDVMGSMGKAY